MLLSQRSLACEVRGVGGLTAVLRVRPPLPFHFFKRWAMHDFHTSKWTRQNPSAQIKRTRLGRSCIDQPTMDMVSVSRYGGHTRREALATAFRVYRSVDQSEAARRAGQEVLQTMQFTDFAAGEEEEQELAVDFACLYLNACVLFGVVPTLAMVSELLSWLATSLYSSFHWECVLCALAVYLRSSQKTATATALAFLSMLRGAEAGKVPGSLSRDGGILLLIVVARAMDVLLRANARAEELQQLLQVQLETIEMLCSTTPTPTATAASFSREEMLTLADAVCWRHVAGASLVIAAKVLPKLQVKTHAGLEELSVPQCARLFCALCILLAAQHAPGSAWTPEQQSHVLDPIVRHLDERVRVHSVDDAVCVLVGLQANSMARLRYKKFPSALLEHIREQQQEKQQGSQQGQEEGDGLACLKHDDSLLALSQVLSQLATDTDDALAEAAETILTECFS
ncbi:uncharacterized protein Tco025E_03956 [Trypanosoma conorhini]|uniref:Uncharacterized protein n=1 Tax=Trypanosoma conorhini TaxID=83891 RepID=A0A3R7PHG0_9TRYP|nr:uncharacterized protein Tco025E_03956 [Trypanosoma conorhini]RNF19965.1 hypothetical protein Tco025E_03956 [Trypanosoma conorhini]